jgi:hypothetical protein
VADREIQLTLLYPSAFNKSFMYHLLPDILWDPAAKVLTKVVPEIAMVWTYIIGEKQSCCTIQKVETGLCRL